MKIQSICLAIIEIGIMLCLHNYTMAAWCTDEEYQGYSNGYGLKTLKKTYDDLNNKQVDLINQIDKIKRDTDEEITNFTEQ